MKSGTINQSYSKTDPPKETDLTKETDSTKETAKISYQAAAAGIPREAAAAYAGPL